MVGEKQNEKNVLI